MRLIKDFCEDSSAEGFKRFKTTSTRQLQQFIQTLKNRKVQLEQHLEVAKKMILEESTKREKMIGDYQKQKEQIYATAQYNLALMCESGRGFPKDENRAYRLYDEAAKRGNADAQFSLGMIAEAHPYDGSCDFLNVKLTVPFFDSFFQKNSLVNLFKKRRSKDMCIPFTRLVAKSPTVLLCPTLFTFLQPFQDKSRIQYSEK